MSLTPQDILEIRAHAKFLSLNGERLVNQVVAEWEAQRAELAARERKEVELRKRERVLEDGLREVDFQFSQGTPERIPANYGASLIRISSVDPESAGT